jgi:hypothetical protein
MYSIPFSTRVKNTSKVLGVSVDQLYKILMEAGIDDTPQGVLTLKSAEISDLMEIFDSINGNFLKLRKKAAASILKDENQERPKIMEATPVNSFVEVMKSLKPIQQWDDKSLLESFISTRSIESMEELDRRAKHQKFVVLKNPATLNLKKYEPGKEEIDVEMTLKLLKDTRKRVVPSMLPDQDGSIIIVYRITELNIEDRIVELCPFCGEILFNGFCEKCITDFSCIGDDERSYIKLVVDSGNFESKASMERKAIIASACKGLNDLKTVTWPSLSNKFDELKLTGNLPKLKMFKSTPAINPSTQVKDPFFADGNRAFGQRTY